MTQRECSRNDCTSKPVARGLCSKHYAQWARSRNDGPRCSAGDCDGPHYAKGLCNMHYTRQRLTGTTDDPREMCRRKLHEMTPENTITNEDGKRRCRACLDEWKLSHEAGPCSVENCDDPVLARTWCGKHYKAWQAHGDPLGPPPEDRDLPGEHWLPVPGWEGFYEVSDTGRVWSVRRRRLLTPYRDNYGYLTVALCRSRTQEDGKQITMPVHRIEARAFLGPKPRGLGVRHLDGNQLNNLSTNLCYGTQKQNIHDSMEHGTHYGRRRAAEVAERPECVNGHPYLPGNFYFNKAGSKVCRICDQEKTARYLAQKAGTGG